MKTVLFLSISFLASPNLFAQDISAKELVPLTSVDLSRYAGTWYEIARLPNRFQKRCSGDVTATYTLLDNRNIKVVNRCRKENGELTTAEGLARRASEEGSNAKLKVRFAAAFLSFLPSVWGNYWIIDLAADYSYAVVGEPDREYLWILSRTPVMDETTLNGIIDRVRQQGYDTASLIKTRHTE